MMCRLFQKSLLVLLATLSFAVTDVAAQSAMKEAFRQMPDSLLPYLTTNNRLDLIDFMDSGMKASVKNTLGGQSEMTRLTDSYLSLRLSESLTLDMRVLPLSSQEGSASDSLRYVVCVVKTYTSNIVESSVAFYSSTWEPLAGENFLNLPSGAPCVVILGENDTPATLKYEYAMDEPLGKEEKNAQKVQTVLKWNGETFK